MVKVKYKDMEKEYARKYSIIVNKEDLNLDIYCLNSNESIKWLLKDLSENKKERISLIGKTLSGIFPEMIQYNFSKSAIDGTTPMFYFYKNEVDMEYFASKLYACIRDIYTNIKMPDSEKVVIVEHLTEVLNLSRLYKVTNDVNSTIIEKAIKYNIYSLIASNQFEIGIDEIKRLYPSDNLVMNHYEDRLNSHDFRIVDFMIGNNGSDLLCISTPIGFNNFYVSYTANLNIQPYGDNSYEVFYSNTVRRWVNEENIEFEFDKKKSICFSTEGTNKILVLDFENKNSRDGKYKYSLSEASNNAIKEISNKDFYDVVSNPSKYMREGKGFAGIPICQKIVGSLNKEKYREATGDGSVDALFMFDKICEILDKSNFKFRKSADMEILNVAEFSVVKDGVFDVRYAHVDEEVKTITVFYYYKDEELKKVFMETLEEMKYKDNNIFELDSEDDCIYIFNNRLNDKEIQFKVVFIETEMFQELLPKVDSQTIGGDIEDKEIIKSLVAEARKKNANAFVNKCRDFILDNIDEYIEDENEMIVNIVDIPSFHERGYTYRDPYKYVKEAFMKEGYHVQVRNMAEYNKKIHGKIKNSFISSVGDIYTKLGVYVGFKNNKKAIETLNSIDKDYIVGINYMNIDGINVVAAMKLDNNGLKIKIPKISINNDTVILQGSTSWEPIYVGIEKINNLIKDIKLFKGKRYVLKMCVADINIEFIKRIAVDSRAIYMFRNIVAKSIKDTLKDICYVVLRDEVTVKHSTFANEKDEDYKITASCMVAKDLEAKNSYISVSKRPTTLKSAPTISSLFVQQDYDVRRARALLFDVYGTDYYDAVASLIHETRKMCFSYDASTNLPHPLHLIGLLGDEIGKAEQDI